MARKRPGRPRKPGRPKKGSSTSRRRSTRKRSTGRRKSNKKFIQGAIKRPGALTRAKKKGESTRAAAQRLKKSGTTLQKRQANFYLNVLSKANRRRSRKG